MSIPPLVCSTPPPPDQCEDDKDPEDFDLSYSLSQEDEDYENNDFSYSNFTSYNHFQSGPDDNLQDIKEHEIKKNVKSVVPNEIILKYENLEGLENNITTHTVIGGSDINENKLRCEDEINIEDLNLKVDKEIESIVENNIEQIEVTDENIDIVKDFSIPCNTNIDSPICYTTNTSPFEESTVEDCHAPKESNSNLFTPVSSQPIDIHVEAEPELKHADSVIADNSVSSVNQFKESVNLEETLVKSVDREDLKHISLKLEENVVIDDDFEDFQSVNIESNVTNVVENDDPWQNTDTNDSDFGDFRANFEEIKFQSANLDSPVDHIDASSKQEQFESDTQEIEVIKNLHDSDDYDDFDDFKSSSIKNMSTESRENSQCNELPVLNLQLIENEHQIMERIAKVLSSVFLEEISEPEVEFEGQLETHLSETWGYLKETDERQPYIVNWNNSFGQKTLLKALCIDSRNILFGPKWSSHTPKYAVNLSNAPLQPQKQVSAPSIVTQNESVTGKPSGNPMSWRDPFTSDGQESCNTENESAAITPGPTDLDVFEATTKADKIFSTTMGVQPLRQINLPDTHIFTPTDSEIPRSKTIHYDLGPAVHLQSAAEIENQSNTQNSASTNRIIENNNEIEDSEQWEFQNFKSSDISSVQGNLNSSIAISQDKNQEIATTVNALPQLSVAYQTELLQPIKVESTIPTLNWPDPGEVKDVFEDFSDFVSLSSQPANHQNNDPSLADSISSMEKIKTSTVSAPYDKISSVSNVAIKTCNNDDFDDDFDTFQSALPSKTANESVVNSNQSSSPELVSKVQKVENIRPDIISFTHIPKSDEILTQKVGDLNSKELITTKSLLPLGNLLQPTPASSMVNIQTQQKSAQILQPLSLESYSQINWPSPGIDLQDLSRFNPVETLHSLKSDVNVSGPNKGASPVHTNQASEDDVWGDFVSSKPKLSQPKKPSTFVDDDEWTDFISSPSVQPQNGLNTISLNVYTNSNIHKSVQNKLAKKTNQPPIDIPTLNYITPKSNHHKSYNDKHFQNL